EKRATVIYLMIAFGDFDKYYTTNGKFDPDISKMTKTPNPIEILGEKCAKYAVVSDDEIEITINKGNYFYKEFIEMDEPFMKANENFTLKKSDEMSDIWVFSPKK
ncbi:MAG: hypothetical protein J6W17_05590, partial [Campylobacter sp.]|nr:hypothetical protein [Campylobacter sp.]